MYGSSTAFKLSTLQRPSAKQKVVPFRLPEDTPKSTLPSSQSNLQTNGKQETKKNVTITKEVTFAGEKIKLNKH